MTVYRIVWVRASGEEVPDLDTYPSVIDALLHAFSVQLWTGLIVDFDIVPAKSDYLYGT